MNKTRTLVMTFLALALCGTSAWAQGRRISGRLTVEGSGEAIGSATVTILGTTFGTVTGEDGRFSLAAPEGPVSVRARRIGYVPKIIPVGAGINDVNIALAKDVLQLETQVVTGQTTTVSTSNIANAVTVVSGEKLNRAPAQGIDQALQGRVPGAVITSNSGAPGGGTQIQLRGATSVNASSNPLYVVDGIIINNSAISNGINSVTGAAGGNFASNQDQQVNRVADINPQDIETVEILKGASAGAIYGSGGSNGVIIITTKRGRAGKAEIGVIQRFGTQMLSNKLGARCFGSAAEVAATGYDPTGFDTAPIKCRDYEQELYGRKDLSYETDLSVRGGSPNGSTTYFMAGSVRHDAPYTIISATPSFFDFTPKDGVYPYNPYLPVGTNLLQDAALIRTPENVYRLLGSATGEWTALRSARGPCCCP
jgi:TonB-dependent starch-binding outer membrane protein SusC